MNPQGPDSTERLVLRRWVASDRDAFHELNSDPAVMSTIGPVMTRFESDAFMERIDARFEQLGFGLWCVEHCGAAIGFTGLVPPSFRDGVEIGWRIKSEHWGNGFAPEAARSCLRFAFQALGLEDVISFSAAINLRSQRVMEKIGMTRDDEADFDHPSVALGSPLRLHVLYRITAGHYRELL